MQIFIFSFYLHKKKDKIYRKYIYIYIYCDGVNNLILFTCCIILEYLKTKFNNQEIKYTYIKSDSIYKI